MGHAKDMVPALMMPGEFAVPPDRLTPETLAAIKSDLKANGIAFDDHIVGSPSVPIDPDSGLPMFNGGAGGGAGSGLGGGSRGGRDRGGRAGGVGTANVGGGFSSTSANKARAERSQSPSKALGLDPISAAAIPGIGAADLAHSLAKAIGPAIQGAFESVFGVKGTAPAIDTSFTDVPGVDDRPDRRRVRSSILLADALGKITPITANAENVVNTPTSADKAAERVRLAAKKRRGRRASILANISEEEAQLTNISRPGAGSLTFGG